MAGHLVETAYERGWSQLDNGALLQMAEAAGFDVFVTTDRHLRHQQNLRGRRLAIVVLLSTSWPRIKCVLPSISEAVAGALPGTYLEVSVPSTI